ncbi:hypothetical protein K5549_010930 [Capra hircus]|nr:hypothetical protein K5549_010930 [Capra hircus]
MNGHRLGKRQSGSFLSTGWFTMILALELCEEIVVYGMVSDSYCREEHHPSVPYHYFEKGRLDECQMYLAHERAPRSAHRFITEKAVFSRWAKKRPIVFAHPSWRTQWPHRHSAITRPLLQPHSAKNT